MNKRNNTIDLLKLIMSLIVVIYHISVNLDGFSVFKRGLLAVDFFFIVSGYLLMRSIHKSEKTDSVYQDNIKFIFKKYKSFFPFVFVGFITCLSYRIIIDKIPLHTIMNSIFSLFLLQMSGLPMSKINNQTWYLSVMLISMFILYPIIRKKKDKYLNWYCPLIVIMGFGLFTKVFNNFNNLRNYKIFMYSGFLRGFLEINLGCLVYNISEKIKNLKFTKFQKVAFTIMELFGYGFTFFIMNTINTKLDIFIALILANSILISFSRVSYLNKITDKINLKHMDKFSLSIYCNHIAVISIMIYLNKYMKLSAFNLAMLIFGISVVFSAILVILVENIKKNKYKVIAIVILVVLLLGGGYYIDNMNVIKYKQVVKSEDYVAHALGGINEFAYTNSKEALENSYNNGFRIFEADVKLTSDKKLVCVHGWSKKDYEERLGIQYNKEKAIMDYDIFMSLKIQGKYTPLSFKDLAKFIEEHQDMYVMIDIGSKSYEDTKEVYTKIVEDCNNNDKVLQRLIVGGHTTKMIKAVKECYDFDIINLYWPKKSKREEKINTKSKFAEYCKQNGITSVSLSSDVYTEAFGKYMQKNNIIVYVFTENEESKAKDILKNADLVGTDFIQVSK